MAFRFFFRLLLALGVLANAAHADDILSKQDAEQLFAMPLTTWVANGEALKQTGQADFAKANDMEYTLYYKTADGVVAVTPSYTKQDNKVPFKVTMTAVHEGEDAELIWSLADTQLKDMIKTWYLQMKPEYTVLTKFDLEKMLASTTFSIFQAGAIAEIDIVAEQGNGCWQQCVLRQ